MTDNVAKTRQQDVYQGSQFRGKFYRWLPVTCPIISLAGEWGWTYLPKANYNNCGNACSNILSNAFVSNSNLTSGPSFGGGWRKRGEQANICDVKGRFRALTIGLCLISHLLSTCVYLALVGIINAPWHLHHFDIGLTLISQSLINFFWCRYIKQFQCSIYTSKCPFLLVEYHWVTNPQFWALLVKERDTALWFWNEGVWLQNHCLWLNILMFSEINMISNVLYISNLSVMFLLKGVPKKVPFKSWLTGQHWAVFRPSLTAPCRPGRVFMVRKGKGGVREGWNTHHSWRINQDF